MARPSKSEKEQKEFLNQLSVEQLQEVAALFGISELPENATQEEIIKIFLAAKRNDLNIAPKVELPNGQNMECPKGYAIVTISPKSGNEWGKKSRTAFFLCSQGDTVVGRRGEPVAIKEKFLEVLRNAVKKEIEWDQNRSKNEEGICTIERYVYEEDFHIHAHNPDIEALAAAEKDLIEGAKKFQAAKRQKDILLGGLMAQLTGIKD